MAEVRHRLLVLHPDADRFLALRSASGALAAPSVVLPERHTAEVEHINTAVWERWGIATTVLCGVEYAHTDAGIVRTHALEAHAPVPAREEREEMEWVDLADTGGLVADEEREMIVLWQATMAPAGNAMRPPQPDLRECPWMERGWWRGVRAWIDAHLGAATVVQTRVWESSCVARVQRRGSAAATHFFKALPRAGMREGRVTAWLSGRPGAPQVEAVDQERRWLLLRAFAGASLDDNRDAAEWERAAATWGQLQAATLGRTEELRALGCVERSVDDLAGAIEPLLADTAALMPGHPEGLSRQQIALLRSSAVEMLGRCRELSAAAMPAALDHGDLWPSNILAGGGECIVIDWEDAGVAHPFLGLAPFVAMVREWQVALSLERLADAYLAPFAGVLPEAKLRRLFLRSLPLGMIEMAVRYWRMPVAVVELHPWMREMVPFFLRHAADYADERG